MPIMYIMLSRILGAFADLDTTASTIGVHGNRYNDHHMSLVGR
jgi:hypothetical protein